MTENDFYCENILSGHIPVQKVYETDMVLAFHHTQPYWEKHIVIIPKKHIASLSAPGSCDPQLAAEFLKAINYVTKLVEKEFGGCHVGSNVGNQQSTRHLHWYVNAGKQLKDENGSPILKGVKKK